MRATGLIGLAMALYGLMHVIIKHKFATAPPLVSIFYVYAPFVCISGTFTVFGKNMGVEVPQPSYLQIGWMMMAGMIFFIGDCLFFTGYKEGASVQMATGLAVLLPVSAVICDSFIRWQLPNRYTYCMWGGIVFVLVMSVLSQLESSKMG